MKAVDTVLAFSLYTDPVCQLRTHSTTMSSLPRAPSPDPPDATVVDSSAPGQDTEFVALMKEAIARYEVETKTTLDSSPYTSFDSAAGILAYIQEHEKEFKKFRADGPQWLRKKVEPVAATVQTFCEAFGETVTEVRPCFRCDLRRY